MLRTGLIILCVFFHTDGIHLSGSCCNESGLFVCVLVQTLYFGTYALKIFTGGDAGSLYPHLYNIHPSLLTQLGSKHSRLGVHLQDQLQVRILRNCTQKCCEQRGHCCVGV